MNNPPETPCFVDNAKAFQAGQISTEVYFSNMVEHFRGTRHHPEDDENFDRALWDLDRIGELVKACLWESSFKPVNDTKPLQALLVTCRKGKLPELKVQYSVLAKSPEYATAASLLLPTMVYITCLRNNATMLQYCLSVVDNPSLMFKSHPSITRVAVDDRPNPEIWDTLLSAGWEAEKEGSLIGNAIDMRSSLGTKLLKVVLSHRAQVSPHHLGYAARFGDAEGLGVLLENCTPQEMNVSNALSMATISSYDPIEKMNMLLDKGADIDFIASEMTFDSDMIQAYTERYTWGQFNGTALHLASDWGREDPVRLLLGRGARTDLKDTGGKYAMERVTHHFQVRDLIWEAFEKEWNESQEISVGQEPATLESP